MIKRCSGQCARDLEENKINFYKNKKNKSGFSNQCKKCRSQYERKYREIEKIKNGIRRPEYKYNEQGIQLKICVGRCKKELECTIDNFYKTGDKYSSRCKICRAADYQDNKQKKSLKIKEIKLSENGIKLKICAGPCGRELEENEINFHKYDKLNSFRVKCRECHLLHRCELRANLKKKRTKEVKYSENDIALKICKGECDRELECTDINFMNRSDTNKLVNICRECVNKRNREKYYNNHESRRKYNNTYRRNKRKNDPIYKIQGMISLVVRNMLKEHGTTKNNESVMSRLPFTIAEYKEHLEINFAEWMSFNNNGQYIKSTWDDNDPASWNWQLDHIVPQKLLPYDSMDHINFSKCWDLKNLRPLSAKANNKKRNKIEYIPDGIFTPEETEKLLRGEKINIPIINRNKK